MTVNLCLLPDGCRHGQRQQRVCSPPPRSSRAHKQIKRVKRECGVNALRYMQRDTVSTPRQRAPQGATNRAQLKAPATASSASPAPAATPRHFAPPKSLIAAAAEATARHNPASARAKTAASAPADSRPQTMSSRSSRSSRGGLRPCVRSIAHALKVTKYDARHIRF